MKLALLCTVFLFAHSGFAETEVAESANEEDASHTQIAMVNFNGSVCDQNDEDMAYFKMALPAAYNYIHEGTTYKNEAFVNFAVNGTEEDAEKSFFEVLENMGVMVSGEEGLEGVIEEGQDGEVVEDDDGEERKLWGWISKRSWCPECKPGDKYYTSIKWPWKSDKFFIHQRIIHDCKKRYRSWNFCQKVFDVMKYIPRSHPASGFWPRWYYMEWNAKCLVNECAVRREHLWFHEAYYKKKKAQGHGRGTFPYDTREYGNGRRLGKGKGKEHKKGKDKRAKNHKGKDKEMEVQNPMDNTLGQQMTGLPGDTKGKHEEFEIFLAQLLRASPSGCWKDLTSLEVIFPTLEHLEDGTWEDAVAQSKIMAEDDDEEEDFEIDEMEDDMEDYTEDEMEDGMD